jgi:hypothetical protein
MKIPLRYAAMALVLLGTLPAYVSSAQQTRPLSAQELRAQWQNPPAEARLRCYWWWLNGNTDEATIAHDLTEMKQKGFGGVLLVDGNGSNQNGNDLVPPGPTFASPEWVRLYEFMLKTAASLHLEVTLNITSGWNLGGPDVTPEQASKILTWSRVTVDTKGFHGIPPKPQTQLNFYRDIAVLAYPLAHGAALAGAAGSERAALKGLPFRTAAAETGFSMPPSEPLLQDEPATPRRAGHCSPTNHQPDLKGCERWRAHLDAPHRR